MSGAAASGEDSRTVFATRRSVLLATTALPLAACGVRLERDAPQIPGVPTATPPADIAVMQETIARLRALSRALSGQEPAPWTGRLAALHSKQADELTRIAASAGITVEPSTVASSTGVTTTNSSTSTPVTTRPAPTSSPGSATTSSSTITVHPAGVLEADEIKPGRFGAVIRASAQHRPVLLAVLAGHRTGARLLGAVDSPVITGLSATSAVTVLGPVRTATYAAEVLIAKTQVKQRGDLAGLLSFLYAERMRLGSEAGSLAPAEQLSYALPAGSDDPTRARTTMAHLLGSCVVAAASVSGEERDPGGARRTLELWGDLAAAAWTWGTAPTTFLGLK